MSIRLHAVSDYERKVNHAKLDIKFTSEYSREFINSIISKYSGILSDKNISKTYFKFLDSHNDDENVFEEEEKFLNEIDNILLYLLLDHLEDSGEDEIKFDLEIAKKLCKDTGLKYKYFSDVLDAYIEQTK